MLATAGHLVQRYFRACGRATLLLFLAVSLVCNLIAGSYSGIVHAHEHAQEHSHTKAGHHHDDDEADAANSGGSGAVVPSANGGNSNQTHDHPAELVLCLTEPMLCTPWRGHPSQTPSRHPPVAVYEFGPSERPPRSV